MPDFVNRREWMTATALAAGSVPIASTLGVEPPHVPPGSVAFHARCLFDTRSTCS